MRNHHAGVGTSVKFGDHTGTIKSITRTGAEMEDADVVVLQSISPIIPGSPTVTLRSRDLAPTGPIHIRSLGPQRGATDPKDPYDHWGV